MNHSSWKVLSPKWQNFVRVLLAVLVVQGVAGGCWGVGTSAFEVEAPVVLTYSQCLLGPTAPGSLVFCLQAQMRGPLWPTDRASLSPDTRKDIDTRDLTAGGCSRVSGFVRPRKGGCAEPKRVQESTIIILIAFRVPICGLLNSGRGQL